LAGLIPRSVPGVLSGSVKVDGRVLSEASVAELAQTVGLVFQDPNSQFCMLRIDDEVAFGLENLRVPPNQMSYRIGSALSVVGLAPGRGRIDHLSGGAKQRLAIASVLAMEPRFLVFDEPTANLDPVGAREVVKGIAALKAERDQTIVIVEHRLDNLIDLVDLVLALGPNGEIRAQGPPRQVFHEFAGELERCGIPVPQVCELVNNLARHGIALGSYPLTVDEATIAVGEILGRVSASAVPGLAGALLDVSNEAVLAKEQSIARGLVPRPPTQIPAIEVSHLSWRYRGGVPALRDVSLTIPEGAVCAIVGPNGAGKSTLASLIAGVLRPERGRVRLFGRDVRDIRPDQLANTVGYVFQNPEHQFVAPTVGDDLAFGLRARRYSEEEITARVDQTACEFGLTKLLDANPYTLSHGEKRRLSVAAITIVQPQILVLDEPTLGLDRSMTDRLLTQLDELHRNGRTVVIVTHDLRLVAEHATMVAVMVAGAIEYAGSVEGLFDQPDMAIQRVVGEPPALQLSRCLRRIDPRFPTILSMKRFAAEIARRVELDDAQRRPETPPRGVSTDKVVQRERLDAGLGASREGTR
jgi:energy-coupling factor transport system ATP-binding protein